MKKKIIDFFKKIPKWFYYTVTIIIGAGVCGVALFIVIYYSVVGKLTKKKKKSEIQVEKNDKEVEEGRAIVRDTDNFIKLMRKKIKRRKLQSKS